MATDANTEQAIFGGHRSWGRTRSPKNLAGSQGGEITPLADTDDLLGITASTAGYFTENQRYLHVLIEETNPGSDTNAAATTVYGYCHAFLRWFEIPESAPFPVGDNTNPTAASIDPPNQATLPAAHLPSSREYRVYHIVGIDKVAFVNSATANVNIFAACSTF